MTKTTTTPIKTGWKTFDNNTNIKRGDLVVISATGSSGASTAAVTLARNATFNKQRVLFVSFETTSSEFQQSWTSCITNIPLHDIRGSHIVESQHALCRRLDSCCTSFSFISGDAHLRIEKLMEFTATQKPRDLIIIDRIEDLQTQREFKSETSRRGYLAKMLKRLAIKHNCVVAATTHLDDRTREIISGKQLGETADIVLSWHTSEENIMDGHVPVRVAKSRHSSSGFNFHLSVEFNIQQMNDVTSRILITSNMEED